MSKAIFVTGTGTDIGKTYVTALIVKKLSDFNKDVTYYKAALSGADEINGDLIPGDAKYVCDVANLKYDPVSLVSYIYKNAVSPHLAAKKEGNPVDIKKVKKDFENAKSNHDFVVVEGSGGIICPIVYEDDNKIMLEDIVKNLDLDTIVIADAGLGTINSTVLTVRYLENAGIKVRGIILNNFIKGDFMHDDNKKMIEEISGIKVIATVSKDDKNLDIDLKDLTDLFKEI